MAHSDDVPAVRAAGEGGGAAGDEKQEPPAPHQHHHHRLQPFPDSLQSLGLLRGLEVTAEWVAKPQANTILL